MIAELARLDEDARREKNWKRWGPYLSERQWGTVREDYSAHGDCWNYFPHDHARSRAYRWGEDGLLGICDRECRLCFALALWNGRDPILKERLFGLSNSEGNHGEDVKECYFYLDATPTHSYMKALYKYPQQEFPYARLVEENRRRGREQTEFELDDTGIFDESRYFDVYVEYAKAGPDDFAIRIRAVNRGPERADLTLLPTLWFRNTWSWGRTGEGYWPKGKISRAGDTAVFAEHVSLGKFRLDAEGSSELLFTENETDMERVFGVNSATAFVKDAFHRYLIEGRADVVNPHGEGTKAGALYRVTLEAGAAATIHLRLAAEDAAGPFNADQVFAARQAEADEFYAAWLSEGYTEESRRIARQAFAGLLWSKQFFHYGVAQWLEGDPAQPPPPPGREYGRNRDWKHLYNRDVISMPDNWEYPWYAAWDLAFHMIPFARLDPHFAKEQLILLLREWYMHPNGQIPAYEFAFSDVNPPVHAWACWRVYKMTGPRGGRDRIFLGRVFQKLLINFTWWVNRKDVEGQNIFSGGFLGLDNIGVFDRSRPLPGNLKLEQADGTAWMAAYCLTMLSMALELAREDPEYEDVASKFFEHFVAIASAMNSLGGNGLWDETDGFYYDQLRVDGTTVPMRARSVVGLVPLLAVAVLDYDDIARLPGFRKRMDWFLENRQDLCEQISYMEQDDDNGHTHRLLAIPSLGRLLRVLKYLLDENEFLSPYGIRSLSKFHQQYPYTLQIDGSEQRVDYEPAESTSGTFGGNSNWRGPVWFPINYLLVEALERYHHFYGDHLRVECPTGSGRMMNLKEVAAEIMSRLARIFLPDEDGRAPWQCCPRYAQDPNWRDLTLFYEFFHADNGRGLGASHQTGWTSLVVRCLEDMARRSAGG
ncbi:MAG: MGH1-like glycoside hydrolase domain-containing protein [Bryobacteraceae bacterium]